MARKNSKLIFGGFFVHPCLLPRVNCILLRSVPLFYFRFHLSIILLLFYNEKNGCLCIEPALIRLPESVHLTTWLADIVWMLQKCELRLNREETWSLTRGLILPINCYEKHSVQNFLPRLYFLGMYFYTSVLKWWQTEIKKKKITKTQT